MFETRASGGRLAEEDVGYLSEGSRGQLRTICSLKLIETYLKR